MMLSPLPLTTAPTLRILLEPDVPRGPQHHPPWLGSPVEALLHLLPAADLLYFNIPEVVFDLNLRCATNILDFGIRG